MSNREQEIERIAQEEVYPERHNRKFAKWPSERTHEVHRLIAEDRYNKRQAEEKSTTRKKKSASQETEENEIADSGDDE